MFRGDPSTWRRRLVPVFVVTVSTVVVFGCLVGLTLGLFGGRSLTEPVNESQPSATPRPTLTEPRTGGGDAVVGLSVAERGLVPEPITSDAVAYGIEAARALVSFDTTQVSRDQFREYIATWVGEDSRYGNDPAELQETRAGKLEVIYNRIIGNSERWTGLGLAKSVLNAVQTGVVKVDYDHVNSQPGEFDELIAGGYHTVTVELDVTTTAVQGGEAMVVTEPLTVSMQINCSASLPVGDTPQVTGDCKIIQYLPEPRI
jgi:hypothetical protein